ncbi:Uncharacterized protein Adt_06528 [Abeliophyllum distichum]|uniref:DUF4283 domain-containing protein n=1 Tax=Abeliophyllum distichum TaxID=126358 RepID=A0ABD1V773_9LAMI
MPQYFRFNDEEISIMPVWVVLPELPLDFWNPKGLGKIASKIDKPISLDNLTSLRGRLSYARVLIEVDAAKELVRTVNIGLPNGDVYDQKVIFEHEPKFCSFCRTFGHSHSSCAFCDKMQEQGPKVAAQISDTERQNSGTKEPTVGAVALPNSVQDTPTTATSIQRSQAQSVANVPLIVPGHNQGQTLQAEGDDDFILVEWKKKLTAAQKGKQQVKGQQPNSGVKGTAACKGIGKETLNLSRSKEIPAKKGQSSLSLDKSKGRILPLSS